jgi:hypothetical protein
MNLLYFLQNYSIVLSFNNTHEPKKEKGRIQLDWDTCDLRINFSMTTENSLSILIIFQIFWYLSSELTCKRDGTVRLVCPEPLEGEQHLDEHPHHHQHHLVAQVQE